MKQLMCIAFGILLAVLIFMPISSALAKAPKVPITYLGDTEETIARRAKWIEGAKKEGRLVWWHTFNPNLANKIVGEYWVGGRATDRC